ncbi:MAG: NHL repeat-containing protein [Candidatus Krumholzibacteriia bacterium]
MKRRSPRPWLAAAAMAALLALGLGACAGGGGRPAGEGPAPAEPAPGAERGPIARPGTRPVSLEFVRVYENERNAPYYPLEGLVAVGFGRDGTLVLADDKRGRVFGFDPERVVWYEFDTAGVRPYRPVDVVVDGFSVWVLDAGSRLLHRFQLGGAFQDRLLNFRNIDPADDTLPTAMAVDRDGRLVVTDGVEEQVLIFDPFLALTQRVGGPGRHDEQFQQPAGVAFLPDGSFVVSDQGNARLQRFNRLGFWEATYGGEWAVDNPLRTPQGLAADHHGNVFVADPAAGAVHVIGPGGDFLHSAARDLPLAAVFQAPVDVAVGPDDLLAVADRARAAVLIFRILYE